MLGEALESAQEQIEADVRENFRQIIRRPIWR